MTSSDYSVEFDIQPQVLRNFTEQYYDETNPMDLVSQFRLYIRLELQKRIQSMPDMGFHNFNDYEQEKAVRIAHITFAYENARVIEWLKERGDYIVNEEWGKIKALNAKIARQLKTNKALHTKLRNPCSVFVTFESEEGQKRACEYSDAVAGKKGSAYEHMKLFKDFLGQKIEI